MIARRKQAFKSIAKTGHFPTELVRRKDHGAQDRVEPGTIATAGQHTDARLHFAKAKSEEFLWISYSTGSGPLIV
jgi:hypothetical protein